MVSTDKKNKKKWIHICILQHCPVVNNVNTTPDLESDQRYVLGETLEVGRCARSRDGRHRYLELFPRVVNTGMCRGIYFSKYYGPEEGEVFSQVSYFSQLLALFCRVLYCLFPLLSENNFQILKLKKYCVLGRFNPPIFLFLLSPTFLFHSYFPKPRPWYYASCIPLHLLNSCMYFYSPYINNFPPGQSWMLSRQWSQNSLPIDSDLDRNKKFYSVTVKTITGWNGNGISVGPMHVRLHPPQVSPKFTAGVFNT